MKFSTIRLILSVAENYWLSLLYFSSFLDTVCKTILPTGLKSQPVLTYDVKADCRNQIYAHQLQALHPVRSSCLYYLIGD